MSESEALTRLKEEHDYLGGSIDSKGILNIDGKKYWIFIGRYIINEQTQRVGEHFYKVNAKNGEVTLDDSLYSQYY